MVTMKQSRGPNSVFVGCGIFEFETTCSSKSNPRIVWGRIWMRQLQLTQPHDIAYNMHAVARRGFGIYYSLLLLLNDHNRVNA